MKKIVNSFLIILMLGLSLISCMHGDPGPFIRHYEDRVFFSIDNSLKDEITLTKEAISIRVQGLYDSFLQKGEITHSLQLRLIIKDTNKSGLEFNPNNIKVYLNDTIMPYNSTDTLLYMSNKGKGILTLQLYFGNVSDEDFQAVSIKRHANPFINVNFDNYICRNGEYMKFETIYLYQQHIEYKI